jgi:hypothetical protein
LVAKLDGVNGNMVLCFGDLDGVLFFTGDANTLRVRICTVVQSRVSRILMT